MDLIAKKDPPQRVPRDQQLDAQHRQVVIEDVFWSGTMMQTTHVEAKSNARITDLHLWRVGPGAHAAIVSVTGVVDNETVRSSLATVHELAHLTVETR